MTSMLRVLNDMSPSRSFSSVAPGGVRICACYRPTELGALDSPLHYAGGIRLANARATHGSLSTRSCHAHRQTARPQRLVVGTALFAAFPPLPGLWPRSRFRCASFGCARCVRTSSGA